MDVWTVCKWGAELKLGGTNLREEEGSCVRKSQSLAMRKTITASVNQKTIIKVTVYASRLISVGFRGQEKDRVGMG
ncbi:hypothetical protein O3M35_012471 [Rhynocoris fuscipes]|uniref:Uncharacterized protein n=1 Tax=Rhynocoris fuscipes TaxID=488301 RepID=A0AAW1CZS8_9HEMI